MGYELNKLMKQYGVATPGAVRYTGPAAPVVPTMPAALGEDPTEEQRAAYDKSKADYEAYQKDPAAFNEMMRKYGLAQKEYNQYRQDYMGRVGATPMYSDAQFYTGPSAGMQAATAKDGIGADKYNQNIQDFFKQNPNVTPQDVRAAMDKYGISGYDVAQARGTPGSMWGGTTVAAPTYGAVPVTLAGKTAEEKADYYKRLRDIGYTDPDIRESTQKNFGKINEGDWRNLLNRVYPQYQGNVEAAYGNIGRSGYGKDVANIDDAGYNYWLNQLSSGAVKPGDLNTAVYNAANTWMPSTTFDATKVPTDFNWSYYVNKYPDLYKAGIDTLQEAQRHYALYGAGEGRSPYQGYVPPTPTSTVGPILSKNDIVTDESSPVFVGPPQDNYVDYGSFYSHGGVHKMAQKYGMGGAVHNFSVGGNKGRTARGYASAEDEAEFDRLFFTPSQNAESFPVPDARADNYERPSMQGTPLMRLQPPTVKSDDAPLTQVASAPTVTATDAAPVTASPAVQPVKAPPAAVTPVSPAANDLMRMMQQYGVGESIYGPELKAARERVTQADEAFQKMIANAMKPDGTAPDKTEMYFRLAAAFGAPSKTGHFTENLAMVGKELGEYAKEQRLSKKAERQLQLQLGIEAQKLKAQSARDELTTLRTLAGEEMKDKRAILQEYIKSGRPQSEAGKAAVDAGLTQGTPEFTAFVKEYIDDKIRSGNMLKEAMVAIAAGGLQVRQAAEARATESAKKLTPGEVKLKSEAETTLGGIDDSMASLKRAYSLNPNTFDGTLVDIGRRKLLEQTDPKDPRVLATREQANLLSKGAIDKLRASFGGNPTEGERAALLQLEGLDSKSKEERALIMKNTYKLLQARRQREQKRLNDINAGLYRETTPAPSGEIE